MSTSDPAPASPAPPPPPARPALPPRPTPPAQGTSMLGCAFGLSFVINLLAAVVIGILCVGLRLKGTSLGEDDRTSAPLEKHLSGNKLSSSKVAIVSLEGVIMEGFLTSVHQQIEQAAKDDNVKAVVFRINSPGGSITASDDLHQRILRLRDGDPAKGTKPKPLVVSMGSVAASGGYFVAVPARTIFAERSTITGSIGVYASLPNVKELADTYGVHMNTIKAGEIKDSGSPFRDLSPKERQVWQDMVNDAYSQFLDVVAAGRPGLTKDKLLERFDVTPLRPDPQAEPKEKPAVYQRYRADGGIFTAPKAKELKLIDDIGDVDDAAKAAATLAGVADYQVVKYLKQKTLTDYLLGTKANPAPAGLLDPEKLQGVLSPRLWYLAPGYESAGLLAAGKAG